MELIALWRVFRRRWWLVLLPALGALLLAAPDLLNSPAAGGGWTTLIHFTAALPTEGDETSYEDAAYFPWLASEYVVNGLADWVRTSSFARAVSEGLAERGIEVEAGAVRAAVAADNARSVMQLYLSWPDHDQLQAMAEVALDVLRHRSQDYFPQFAGQPLQVIPLDDITLTPVAPPLTNRFAPLLKGALGLAVGVGLAALAEYLDDSVHSRDDLEAMALPVLGEIPSHRGR